jgi:hypothetical protein
MDTSEAQQGYGEVTRQSTQFLIEFFSDPFAFCSNDAIKAHLQ